MKNEKYFLRDIYRGQRAVISVREMDIGMQLNAIKAQIFSESCLKDELEELNEKRVVLDLEIQKLGLDDDIDEWEDRDLW